MDKSYDIPSLRSLPCSAAQLADHIPASGIGLPVWRESYFRTAKVPFSCSESGTFIRRKRHFHHVKMPFSDER